MNKECLEIASITARACEDPVPHVVTIAMVHGTRGVAFCERRGSIVGVEVEMTKLESGFESAQWRSSNRRRGIGPGVVAQGVGKIEKGY